MTQKIHTKDFLAAELRKVGLEDVAKRAETGYYHDYLSPLTFPEMQLLNDLRYWYAKTSEVLQKEQIKSLIKRHMNGEFDASKEEGDEWAKSEDGQEAFRLFGIKPL